MYSNQLLVVHYFLGNYLCSSPLRKIMPFLTRAPASAMYCITVYGGTDARFQPSRRSEKPANPGCSSVPGSNVRLGHFPPRSTSYPVASCRSSCFFRSGYQSLNALEMALLADHIARSYLLAPPSVHREGCLPPSRLVADPVNPARRYSRKRCLGRARPRRNFVRID